METRVLIATSHLLGTLWFSARKDGKKKIKRKHIKDALKGPTAAERGRQLDKRNGKLKPSTDQSKTAGG